MNERPYFTVGGSPSAINDADLHAYVDGRLTETRQGEVERFLASRPEEQERVRDWLRQDVILREAFDPVMDEVMPTRLSRAPATSTSRWGALAAGLAIAVVSSSAAWLARGTFDAHAIARSSDLARVDAPALVATNNDLRGFARRAAIAHVVYSPDMRRPVEVGADQEQSLVTWLTKRMGANVRPPSLKSLGYELIGGRLLPGEKGPVAQFMYGAADGMRLTLYVTREVSGANEGFRFGQDGSVNVLYWIDNRFGYAVSAGADREALAKVSEEVYRQLGKSQASERTTAETD